LEVAELAQRRMLAAGGRSGRSLPEIVPFEPVPLVRGTTRGWWTMWEVAVGRDRTAMAIFISDTGAVRPDLADRLWTSLAETAAIGVSTVLDNQTFDRLHVAAADHGYRAPGDAMPLLVLRLAVRVEP